MWRLLCLANLLVLSRSDISCDKAIERCRYDLKCAPFLRQLFDNDTCTSALGYDPYWKRIKGAMGPTCPRACVQAIQKLTLTPRGKAMESCVCDQDAMCLTVKARLQRCILKSEGNYTIFSCTKARKNCSSNPDCLKTQKNFLRRCTQLISGQKCTQDCKDSQDELLSSELGKALNDCECDGAEEPYCRGIRANYEALCKATREPRDPNILSTPPSQGHTVMQYNRNSSARTLFELPVWILYTAIMAHVYVLYNR